MSTDTQALAEQQAQLLAAIWQASAADDPGPWSPTGLQAYRGNAQALAERVFSAAYPVLRQCLGEDSWAALARDHGRDVPPRCGDLAHWGEGLADWLEPRLQAHDLPQWMPELARAEWQLHRLAAWPDGTADPASLARLLHEAPEALALRLAPGTALRTSRWPLASLLHAHGAGTGQGSAEPAAKPDPQALQAVGELLRQGVGETVLFWRAGWRPRAQALSPSEAAWFESLLSQPHLGAALDAFGQTGLALDLSAWLEQALHQQWLIAVQDAPASTPPP
ncbi:DNA-binding domain-containing protein [Curvibacter sp. HBC28]|uniref:DNA-binding domain-containing protein n=1 Tax=Curvibacter microcysteis TaxID=3026419 RepID=A0ABT5MLL7_9BURK|nr:DNA-binding domain-containing protein [Curvibacter sp. HBC28]MDD0816061.1 DNA-binding domain-containing protein [Curvibacter sp. HBC28]